jgi:hypothetical protein|tara:strand:- start:489 stop:845 length:357 start_codon:yes stop_codon:yes gene_type:complete
MSMSDAKISGTGNAAMVAAMTGFFRDISKIKPVNDLDEVRGAVVLVTDPNHAGVFLGGASRGPEGPVFKGTVHYFRAPKDGENEARCYGQGPTNGRYGPDFATPEQVQRGQVFLLQGL